MNKLVDSALGDVARGHGASLAEFGIERLTVAGIGMPYGAFEWDERLTVNGDGVVHLRTRRSIADISSEPIGEFRHTASRETARKLAELIREAQLSDFPRTHIEPTEMRTRITVAVRGVCHQVSISSSDPEALLPLQPLLQELDRLAALVRAAPQMTLSVSLQMPSNARAAKTLVPVSLVLENAGNLGYWLTYPGALQRGGAGERCSILYGRKPEIRPGFTPPPFQMEEAQLDSTSSEPLDLIWLQPMSASEQRLKGTLMFTEPGTYLARAVYSSYSGDDQLGGRPRMRGCAFSNEVAIEVQ